MNIAILGGTGAEGFGLGYQWASAGHTIIIGSRQAEKGARAAADLKERVPDAIISGTDNLTASLQAEVVVLSVPYSAQEATLATVKDALANKLLVTVVAPLNEKKKARLWQSASGLSAAEEAQQQVGPDVRVVAAFQNIGSHHLLNKEHEIDCDVLICGDKAVDKNVVLELCRDAGFRGINAGALQNSSVVEGLVAVLIGINIRHKIKNAGIRITGIEHEG